MTNTRDDNQLLIAFYGDDFTGSTDALERLCAGGVPTVLFLEPPTPEQLEAYPHVRGVGVAGRTRSLPTAEIEDEVRPALAALRDLAPRHVHYKVCSTFDSSPGVGSIGRVIDVASGLLPGPFVPLVVATPALGRWCVFGNLFARMGIGSEGAIYRLDRHPAMRDHPTTPADESDLRVHLSRQTERRVALLSVLDIALPSPQAAERLSDLLADRPDVVLFDALYPEHMPTIGELIDGYADPKRPLFSVGSSGIETALTAAWAAQRVTRPVTEWPEVGPADKTLVLCGSLSPVTREQIDYATSACMHGVAIDARAILEGQDEGRALAHCADQAVEQLNAGGSVVVHTLGDHDQTRRPAPDAARRLGRALGEVGARCVQLAGVRRICVAGGDTSSYAARAMGVESLEMIAPFSPGAPLCRVRSARPLIDDLEIVFKGGQVGRPDFFTALAAGGR